MSNLKDFIVSPHISVREAVAKVNSTGKKTVFVVDDNEKLVGLFTDGDMRKYILRNGDMGARVSEAMNASPVVYRLKDEARLRSEMATRKMIVYPVVDDEGHLIQAYFWDELSAGMGNRKLRVPDSVSTVIMAGGLGTRLYPYTKVLPKALIPIGELPICSHIMNSFMQCGCGQFHLILNHKHEMIKAYYKEESMSCDIQYHKEEAFLGTAGGLYLLKGKIHDTCFVTNCDILVDTDYGCVYHYHKKEKNLITVIGAIKDVQIPYGVIKLSAESDISEISEKPKFSFLTNVGVYLIEPEVIEDLKDNEFIHMPDLIRRYVDMGRKVGVFPVSGEQWLDMGQLEEMKRMTDVLEQRAKAELKRG